MTLFTPSLWPPKVRHPYRRLAAALIVSPALVSAILAGGAYLVADITETTRERVIEVTIDSAITIAAVLGIFTLTFGLIGVVVLWMTMQRGSFAWTATGSLLGVIAGTGLGLYLRTGPDLVLMGGFGLVGFTLFLLIRWIAGIAEDAET